MNKYLIIICIVAFGGNSVSALSFQNLDFEQATLQFPPPNYVPANINIPFDAAHALPHWIVNNGDTAIWGEYPLDQRAVGLGCRNNTLYPSDSENTIQGNFNAFLAEGAAISQIGDIPIDAKSIIFYVRPFPGAAMKPGVSIDAVPLNIFTVSTTSNVTLMAADISPFAGSTRELSFNSAALGGNFAHELDNISFSPLTLQQLGVVPEPTSALLLTTPLAALLLRRQKFSR